MQRSPDQRLKVTLRHLDYSNDDLRAIRAEKTSSSALIEAREIQSSFTPEQWTITSSGDRVYNYSQESPLLTREQRDFYEQNGYLVVRRLLDPQLLEKYKERFVALCDKKLPSPPSMTMMRDVKLAKETNLAGEKIINKVQDFQDEEVLFSYCQETAILDYVEAFVGPNIQTIHTMLINKPPDTGALTSRHPLHQDLYYFPFRPANRICAAWTALERVDRSNGCLVVIPGTHRLQTLYPHKYPDWEGGVNKAYHGIQNLPAKLLEQLVYLPMEAGDTVFFHPLLIHGSGANRTTGYRKAISCHLASMDCNVIDVKGTVQAEIADEIEGMFKTKAKRYFGQEASATFQDIWKMKSRCVRVHNPVLPNNVVELS